MATIVLSLKSDEGEAVASYELPLASEVLARVVIDQVRFLLAGGQVRREQRLSQVYKILIEYSDPGSGECHYSQDELAAAAGISPRHLRRQIKDLEARGLVVIKPRRLPLSPKTKNSYYLPHLASALELLAASDTLEADADLSGQPTSGPKALPAQKPGPGKLVPPETEDKSQTSKDALTPGHVHNRHLLFLDEAQRRDRLRQPHCTPSYLQAWDDWYAAGNFKGLTNPPGWANTMIKQGFLPPPVTPRLPFVDESSSLPSADETEAPTEPAGPLDPNETLWAAVLEQLYHQMTRATFDTLLKTTRLAAREGLRFTIATKNPFAVEWLETRLAPLIKRTIASVSGEEAEQVELNFIIV